MLLAALRRLLRRPPGRLNRMRPASRSVHRSRFQPRLEALETRSLLSVFTVTNLGDAGVGTGQEGDLRYCITQANTNADLSNRIVFQPGLSGTIKLTQGVLEVSKPLDLVGPGADVLTISGNNQSGVFDIEAPAGQTVILSDLTIADGIGAGQQFGLVAGGGLFNDAANLILDHTTFSRNTVPFGASNAGGGGAIFNAQGTVTLNASTITDNQAGMAPGVAIRNLGTMTLDNSTVSGNPGGLNGTIANDGTMTLDQCVVADNGNDIANKGTLTMTACTVTGNTAFNGAGLSNVGRATVTDSTFLNNSSTLSGGAIAQLLGETTVSSSTIANNTAGTGGGGIVVLDGLLQLTNSTVSGNVGREGGGIYYAQSGLDVPVLEVTSSTITLNRTTGTFIAGGGGISINNTDSQPARALIRNTIIAGNQTALRGPDVDGQVLSLGYNLVGQTDGSTGWVDTDLQGTSANPLDPLLGPLQDNGGPTPTHALLVGSPAIDTGDPAVVGSLDQRGVIRGIGGTNIGAYQASASAFVLTAPATVTAGTPFDVTVTAVDPFGQTAFGYTGTVNFTSTDAAATFADNDGTPLPGNRYTFTAADAGTHTFSVMLTSAGLQSVTIGDSLTGVSASQNVQVNPGAAVGFEVLVPISPVKAHRPTPVIVTAMDAYGNEGAIYTGTINFSSTDGSATFADSNGTALPSNNYTFTAADQGTHVFLVTFRTRGMQSLTVTDIANGTINGTDGNVNVV